MMSRGLPFNFSERVSKGVEFDTSRCCLPPFRHRPEREGLPRRLGELSVTEATGRERMSSEWLPSRLSSHFLNSSGDQ
jgi:hypothetical protein